MAKNSKNLIKKENKNMANKRIKIVGNAFVLTSTLKLADIRKMEKYDADACVVVAKYDNGETAEVFRIATGKTGSICKHGVVFATANAEGYATVTGFIPENVNNKKAYLKDNFASTFFALAELEKHLAQESDNVDKAFAALDAEIEEE